MPLTLPHERRDEQRNECEHLAMRGEPSRHEGDDVAHRIMYVIATLAVGGSFPEVPDDPGVFPTSYDIDYIRVYQGGKDPD